MVEEVGVVEDGEVGAGAVMDLVSATALAGVTLVGVGAIGDILDGDTPTMASTEMLKEELSMMQIEQDKLGMMQKLPRSALAKPNEAFNLVVVVDQHNLLTITDAIIKNRH